SRSSSCRREPRWARSSPGSARCGDGTSKLRPSREGAAPWTSRASWRRRATRRSRPGRTRASGTGWPCSPATTSARSSSLTRPLMARPGTDAQPLRVAIVGAGPTGYYAADALLRKEGVVVEVDLYDRLPTPYGLVRLGVAPDHQKIKSVTAAFDKVAASPRFRFFGNVEFGKDVTLADLR